MAERIRSGFLRLRFVSCSSDPPLPRVRLGCAVYLALSLAVARANRISNRLGWVDTWNRGNSKAQNPEKTRKHLQGWLPREHW